MDNAEEVMQLLEEFSKMKPKDIPRELEEYLGYVAKTGDPVYQWPLVKCLFREKLMSVITDFYENTPTIELPPCPNVESFNYDRMKTGLLERLESFHSAPFTVQRICELLTNPRKEYNRVDKYMRAIEKNILVVSTREPGSAKRQDSENNQSDAVLNGIPDSRDVEDGLNSPLLGTPPASNEVIVSTCIEQDEIEINDSSVVIAESDKSCVKTSEGTPPPSLQDSPLIFKTSSEENVQKESGLEEDSKDALETAIKESSDLSTDTNTGSEVVLENVDQIILKEEEELQPTQEVSDRDLPAESEISTPEESSDESTAVNPIQLEPEAESAEVNLNEGINKEQAASDITSQVVSSSEEEETKEVVDISEVIINSSSTLEQDQEESEKKIVIVESPDEIPNSPLLGDISDEEDSLQTISENQNPDSTNELVQDDKELPSKGNDDICTSGFTDGSEAEPLPNSLGLLQAPNTSDSEETECSSESLKLEENNTIDVTPHITITPESTTITEEISESVEQETQEMSQPEVNKIPQVVSLVTDTCNENSTSIDIVIKEKASVDLIESTNDISDQERQEGSIIHTTPNLTPEIEPVLAMEEVSVDQISCDVEEAMDIDESSNHQMITSECENEGEPMDQSDQPQS